MQGLREYFTAVLAVCMLAVIVNSLAKKGNIQKIVRLVLGILIVLVVLKPLGAIDLDALSMGFLELTGQQLDLQEPEEAYKTALHKQIKESTEQYIEDRANVLGAYVQAKVTLSDDEYPVPIAVQIVGSLNTEQAKALHAYVTDSLGIAEENQEWKVYDTIE